MTRLAGFGLHSGCASAITLRRASGPTTIGRATDRASLRELSISGQDRATTATLPSGAKVRSVEHLLAAIAGIGLFHGLSVDIEGDEVPLLDGSAAAIVHALDALAPFESRPAVVAPVVVTRAAEVRLDDALYSFSPVEAATSGGAMSIEVEVDFPRERFGRALAGRASWAGDAESFRRELADARTFGASRELEALRERGLAAHVPLGSVVALDVDDPAWAPRDSQEPVRHKLLDLIGDLARLGAPLAGRLVAARPSHRASSRALDRAIAEGVLVLP